MVILADVVVIIICIPKGKEKPEEVKPDYKELDKQLLNRKEEHADAARTKILNTEQEDNHPTEILPANEAAENKQPYQIVLINQKDSVKTYRLSFNDRVVIGRGKNSCNIPIADDSAVSERHCEVIAENERFYLNDLGSSNGTWLNGRKIVVKSELKSGDVIKLGRGEYTIRLQ